MNAVRCLRCLAGLVLTLHLAVPGRAADRFDSVYLSEFLAHNQHGQQDDDGEGS